MITEAGQEALRKAIRATKRQKSVIVSRKAIEECKAMIRERGATTATGFSLSDNPVYKIAGREVMREMM